MRRGGLAFAVFGVFAAAGLLLSAAAAAADRACVTMDLTFNTTYSGALDTSDCQITSNGNTVYVDFWKFSAAAGTRVTVTYTSNSFGLFSAILKFQDTTFLTSASGNSALVYSYTLPAAGEYVVALSTTAAFATGPYALTVTATVPPGACVPDLTTLCLNQGRFKVQVGWSVPSQGTSGAGTAVVLTGDTGYMWFFSSNNVELVVKVVDGRAFNEHFWVFYGALSDVAYTITVTDTQTGVVRTYVNTQGNLTSRADVIAF